MGQTKWATPNARSPLLPGPRHVLVGIHTGIYRKWRKHIETATSTTYADNIQFGENLGNLG